jgi:hypothetical protein
MYTPNCLSVLFQIISSINFIFYPLVVNNLTIQNRRKIMSGNKNKKTPKARATVSWVKDGPEQEDLEHLIASGQIGPDDTPADIMEKFAQNFGHIGASVFRVNLSKTRKIFDSKIDPSKINIKTLINDIYHSHRAIQ